MVPFFISLRPPLDLLEAIWSLGNLSTATVSLPQPFLFLTDVVVHVGAHLPTATEPVTGDQKRKVILV